MNAGTIDEWSKLADQEAFDLLKQLLADGDDRFFEAVELFSFDSWVWGNILAGATLSQNLSDESRAKAIRLLAVHGQYALRMAEGGEAFPLLHVLSSLGGEKHRISAQILLEEGCGLTVKNKHGSFAWETWHDGGKTPNTETSRYLANLYTTQQANSIAKLTLDATGERVPTRL